MTEMLTVAIVNSTPDAIEMLRQVFYQAGFIVVSCYTHDIRDGKLDYEAFIRQHDPHVVVYDIAPPYERNFRLFQHVRAMPASQQRHFVLTSMNPKRIDHLVGRDQQVYEVVDRAEDLLQIVRAVKEAARARSLS